MRRAPLWIVLGACALVALLVVLRPQKEARPPQERVWPVQAQQVQFVSARPQITSYGEIFAAREVALRAQVAGEIVRTAPQFAEGGSFRSGELMLEIDPFHYRHVLTEARANLRAARAALAEQHTNFYLAWQDAKRGEELFARGTIAVKLRDDYRARYLTAKARYQQQKSAVERLESQQQRAQRDLEDTQIRAPSDGFIDNLSVQRGQQVSRASHLANFIDGDSYEVRFNISDTEYGRLLASKTALIGLPVRLNWKLGEEQMQWEGRVSRIGARIAASTRGTALFARLAKDAVPPNLRAGAFVEVTLEGKLFARVVALPRSALFADNQVMVIEEGRLAAREIRLAAMDDKQAYVAEGLAEGEQVLLTRFEAARAGARVRVEEGPES